MTLRKKLALAVLLAVASFVGVDHFLHNAKFAHRFHQVDIQTGDRLADTIDHRLKETSGDLERLARVFALLLDRSPHAIVNSSADWMESFDLDVLIVSDPSGWVQYHRVIDPRSGQPLTLRSLPNERMGTGHPISQAWQKLDESDPDILRFDGLMSTEAEMLAIGGHRLQQGEVIGNSVMVGRFLTRECLIQIAPDGVEEISMLESKSLLQDEEGGALLDTLLSSPVGRVSHDTGKQIQSHTLIVDIAGAPTMVCRSEHPRAMGSLWEEIHESTILSAVGLLLVFPFTLMLLIQWIVTGPLLRLTAHSVKIANDQSTTDRLEMAREDEIGQLAGQFDQMLDELQASRREVIQSARQAGKADISMRVLHNVGNMLNHAVVGANLNRDAARELPLDDLDRIADQLQGSQEDVLHFLTQDSKGRNLGGFLRALSEELKSKGRRLEVESMEVSERVWEVAKLVQTLQGDSAQSNLSEEVVVGDLLDSVANMVLQSTEGAEGIEFRQEYLWQERAQLDRQKFIEIAFPLVQNAVESVLANGGSGSIRMRCERTEEGNLRVQVADTGLGIDPTDLTQVFAAGHTLKADRQGMGLHLASTAAMELGGNLWAESSGLGAGAQFHLELPLRSRKDAVAAGQPKAA